ncbi:hypothetical protein Tco_0986747 [Tanacetum coccineum]
MAATIIQVPTNGLKKRHSVSVGTVTADSVASCGVHFNFIFSLTLHSNVEGKQNLLVSIVMPCLSDEMRAFTFQDYDGFPFLKLRVAVMTDKGVSVTAAIMAAISITAATTAAISVPTVLFTEAMPFLDKRFIDKEDC